MMRSNFTHGHIPVGGVTRSVETLDFNPNRTERIVLTFKDEARKQELKLDLPIRLSMPFHWAMVTKGFIKV